MKKSSFLMILPLYVFTLIFVLSPLIYMLVLSFAKRQPDWGVLYEFSLNNYRRIFDPTYLKVFAQSFKLAFICTALIALIGYPMGYFMAKLPAKFKTLAMFLFIIPFWTNSLMRLYGWVIIFRANGILDSMLISLHLTSEPLKLLYTYPAVVTGMIYVLLPFMVYAVYSSAEKLDPALTEAARDLGASRFYAFFTISFKLTMPGLLSGVILTFIPSMGLYFIADILGGNKVALVGNLIQEQLVKAHDWAFAAALAVALTICTSVTLFIYRKLTRADNLEGLI